MVLEVADGMSSVLEHVPQGGRWSDPLSEALDCLSLRVWIPGRIELKAPWGFRAAPNLGWFYLIKEQGCYVELEERGGLTPVEAGDLIIVLQGHGHRLFDQSGSPIQPVETLLETHDFAGAAPLHHGGDGPLTSLFCGCFHFGELDHTLVGTSLPPLHRIRGNHGKPDPYVESLLRLLEQDLASPNPCSCSTIHRLVRILLARAARGCMPESPDGSVNWTKAVADPDIGRALGLMHAHPERAWTVAGLADQIAMSRTAFSARFKALVGDPPLHYLTEWRMRKACFLLRTTRAELKEVAARVGYESAAGFSKAFVRWMHTSPGSFRRKSDPNAASPLMAAIAV